MRSCAAALCAVVAFVTLVLYPFLLLLRWLLRHEPRRSRYDVSSGSDCQYVPPHLHAQPDPMIYSQRYLQSQGLSVTWVNPDVTIEQAGVPVDPGSLTPGTTYEVVARIWNGSTNAPAVGLPVRFSYMSFGIGTQTHPIGSATANLGARGAPDCPTFVSCSWTTPAVEGHYCLLVELLWSDDANPLNNVGQSNTQVKKLNSPHASFEFELANLQATRQLVRLEADSYVLMARPSCEGEPKARVSPPPADQIRARADAARREHGADLFPIPADWAVRVQPRELVLEPGQSEKVSVDVTAPDGFSGSKSFNVNAFSESDELVGGVTLTVKS